MSRHFHSPRHWNRAAAENKSPNKKQNFRLCLKFSTHNMNFLREDISDFVDFLDRKRRDFYVDRGTDDLKITLLLKADLENVQCDQKWWMIRWRPLSTMKSAPSLSRIIPAGLSEDRWNIILLLQEGLFLLNFDFWRLEFDRCLCQQHKH